jgi:hypothetical protein
MNFIRDWNDILVYSSITVMVASVLLLLLMKNDDERYL